MVEKDIYDRYDILLRDKEILEKALKIAVNALKDIKKLDRYKETEWEYLADCALRDIKDLE